METPQDLTTETIRIELKKRKLHIIDIANLGNLNHRNIYTMLKNGEPTPHIQFVFYLVFKLWDLSEEFRKQVKK